MKKILYLCTLIISGLNIMAQIDLNDKNWECALNDSLHASNRQFNSTFHETMNKWIAYGQCLASGVTKSGLYSVYQWGNNIINSADSTLIITAYHVQDSLVCGDYDIPAGHICQPDHHKLYYLSGMIETPNLSFRYGYFEMRCKLPVHKGAFPAFWLWDAKDTTQVPVPYYEEIDIFEYSWNIAESPNYITNPNPHGIPDYHTFTSGIYFNDNGTSWEPYARNFPSLDSYGPDLSNWHTYACEWMPEHVIWYCDGRVVNEFYDQQHIPTHSLTLKITYPIDGKYKYNDSEWMGPGYMYIDYVNVYQLIWDCDTDVTITDQSDIDNFDYGVKKSIEITSSLDETVVGSTDKITFRATDSFEITGPFHTENGCEFTVIMQQCPNNN